ncbi:MAG TPA: hypothetical protein VLH84_00180 [Patescibacteria group bacterium]|nr:hypothetical protein [Patescibacteria group bacterium]
MRRRTENAELAARRQILRDFVDAATQTEHVADFEHLQAMVHPGVTTALLMLIPGTANATRRIGPNNISALRSMQGRSRVDGTVWGWATTGDEHTAVMLDESVLGWRGFKQRSGVRIAEGADLRFGTYAFDPKGRYSPNPFSANAVALSRDRAEVQSVDEIGSTPSGLEIADSAAGRTQATLDGFLRVTAQLTGRLLNA